MRGAKFSSQALATGTGIIRASCFDESGWHPGISSTVIAGMHNTRQILQLAPRQGGAWSASSGSAGAGYSLHEPQTPMRLGARASPVEVQSPRPVRAGRGQRKTPGRRHAWQATRQAARRGDVRSAFRWRPPVREGAIRVGRACAWGHLSLRAHARRRWGGIGARR